ncbi:membrane protein, partial [Streptomyces virginiae]
GKPFGSVLVWAVGIGLVCMMLWRLSEAVFGAAGPDGGKPLKRLAAAGRTVFYGVVAFSVLSFAAGGGGHSGDQQSR